MKDMETDYSIHSPLRRPPVGVGALSPQATRRNITDQKYFVVKGRLIIQRTEKRINARSLVVDSTRIENTIV